MVKIDCLWAEDTPSLSHYHMHLLKHVLPSLRTLPHPLPLSPLSLPHFSFAVLCSNSAATSCRKSHGLWWEKSDLKQSQDGSQTVIFFLFLFITVIQQHDASAWSLKACVSLFPPSSDLVCMIKMAVCRGREKEREKKKAEECVGDWERCWGAIGDCVWRRWV